jgi:hypothetical protein
VTYLFKALYFFFFPLDGADGGYLLSFASLHDVPVTPPSDESGNFAKRKIHLCILPSLT